MRISIALFLVIFSPIILFGQVIIPPSGEIDNFGHSIEILVDKSNAMKFDEVIKSTDFAFATHQVPNLNISNNTFWVRMSVQNNSDFNELYIDLKQPTLDAVTFYYNVNASVDSIVNGDFVPINERVYPHQNFVFPIKLNKHETQTYYLRISAHDQIQLPISIGTISQINKVHNTKDTLFGLFSGIMIAILLYNLFIFLKVRERIYGLYIIYLGVIFITQSNLQGYTLRYFWPQQPLIERYSVFVLIALSGITGLIFIMHYIALKKYFNRVSTLFYAFIGIYIIAMLLVVFEQFEIAFMILEINGSFIALSVLAITFIVWRRGNKQAGNLLLAWSAFFLGLFIFVLKDMGVLPYNDFTVNTMTIGSAIEGILLSFGLADRINQLKLEKEEADAQRIKTIEMQNEMLETKVHERTSELEDAKKNIQAQYDHLRLTQKQLVESEKLAGLGQMTAGIAHELNNPINFVSSNVGPLHRDIEDIVTLLKEYNELPENATPEQIKALKEKCDEVGVDFVTKEIHQLLQGIEEGSKRTAEIVRGLRIFARADKDTLVPANINECLSSTVVVMKSITKGQVTLDKNLDESMPYIECFPGKLNQVIANLVSNAVQATKLPGRSVMDRHVGIKSWHDEKMVYISVKDNGCGISEEAKDKIFMPFYTTKAVGEGTGLGLSIAMSIIEEHGGEIEVLSTPGEGSEFIIHLPRTPRGFSRSAA